MNRFATSFIALCLGAQMAVADGPVVVELFTSQGCSSCPPADAFLNELSGRDDVLALALHVDYWDYLGWKDEFADPAHTTRQRGYAAAAHKRMIFTPQMVINGVEHVVGNKQSKALSIIDAMQGEHTVDVSLVRVDGQVEISAVSGTSEPMTVQVVQFDLSHEVVIKRGENAGNTIRYSNIVRDWSVLDQWSGDDAFIETVQVAGPIAVIVQQGTDGRILGAAQLR